LSVPAVKSASTSVTLSTPPAQTTSKYSTREVGEEGADATAGRRHSPVPLEQVRKLALPVEVLLEPVEEDQVHGGDSVRPEWSEPHLVVERQFEGVTVYQ
jgi:hypothetical protein